MAAGRRTDDGEEHRDEELSDQDVDESVDEPETIKEAALENRR